MNGAIRIDLLRWLNSSKYSFSVMATTTPQYEERLEQIAHTSFGSLTDDQVLQLLAERKQLETLRQQYEKIQQEQERVTEAQGKKTEIEEALNRLNALISPDKPDDELIRLIEERKTWEEKLDKISETLKTFGTVVEPGLSEEKKELPEMEVSTDDVSVQQNLESSVPASVSQVDQQPASSFAIDSDFGEQKIVDTTIDPNSELGQYLVQMESSPETMGKILDTLPASAKRDKMFMLAVAALDPAYAMHYADKDVLKKDEDFNLKVVAMKGKRLTGNVLAEMLPEARTAAVVMAAVKHDYRNVRFALPQMTDYDKMLERAKKSALEKVKELKEGVDIGLLVPKILQKDKAFMEKIEQMVPKEEE